MAKQPKSKDRPYSPKTDLVDVTSQSDTRRRFARPYERKLSEADLEKQCSDLLALDGWRTLKTDPVSRREWGKGFGEKGMADRLYIRYNRFASVQKRGRHDADVMWIEWKRPDGRNKQHQKDWQRDERIRGALVLVAREDFPATYEGFCAWYAESGLMRRALLCSISSKDATNAPRAG